MSKPHFQIEMQTKRGTVQAACEHQKLCVVSRCAG
jgi:hypothetical protein